MYANRHALYLAFFIFTLGAVIGIFSQLGDSGFFEYLFGSAYTFETETNIANHDPMAIYKSSGQSEMFSYITINNLKVSFRVFISGILIGLGSIFSIFYEGIRIGAFESFFYQNGVLKESIFTVWLHGTPEISAIIIAGGAGITLGKGLIFPGDKSRLQAFKHSGRESMRIILATVPIFLLAAFIEGYLTRYTDISYFVRGFVILVSLISIVFYFVVYPILIARNGTYERKIIEDRQTIADVNPIFGTLTGQEVFNESLRQFLKYFITCIKWSFIAATSIVLYGVVLKEFIGIEEETYAYSGFSNYGIFTSNPGQKIITILAATILQIFLFQKLSPFNPTAKTYVIIFLSNLLIFFFAFDTALFMILMVTIIPLAILFQISLTQNINEPIGKLAGNSFRLVKNDFGQWFLNIGITCGLMLLGYYIFSLVVWQFYLQPSLNFINLESETALNVVKFFTTVGLYTVGFLFYSFLLINIRLLFLNLKEINDPLLLKEKLVEVSFIKSGRN